MRHSKRGGFRQQMNFLRRQFLQQRGLPLSDVLSEGVVAQALAAVKLRWTDRIYSPLVTLWVFLGQVLNADSSCRAAVARLIAHRLSQGQSPCSAETGAYCQARRRLPERFFAQIACMVGRAFDAQVERRWLWQGRRVYLFDGTTVLMSEKTMLTANKNWVGAACAQSARMRARRPDGGHSAQQGALYV